MIDPGDARSRRARELLISGMFLTISCIVVLLAGWWLYDEQQSENVNVPMEAPVSMNFEPRELVRVLTPDASECSVYDTREAYERAMGSSMAGEKSGGKAAAFRLPSGTKVKVLRQISGGPVQIEVTNGPRQGKQGYVAREYLMR
jgi:hypothetical protein